MIKKILHFKKEEGITIVELLVSVAIFAVVLLTICLFVFWMNFSKSKTEADSIALENARKALDTIGFEIRRAQSIYTPTTTTTQLSLESNAYTPLYEDSAYIDFFLCGTSVCFKRESQSPIFITSNNVNVTSLHFSQVLTGGISSVQTAITVSGVTLTSTTSLRNY